MGHPELKQKTPFEEPLPLLNNAQAFRDIAQKNGPHQLPPLPYATDALSDIISENTVIYHYGKHHKTYVDELNTAISGSRFEKFTLEQIILNTAGEPDHISIFNNAAQVWNHAFYWHSLTPDGGGEPPANLKLMIESSFGSVENCKQQLAEAASSQFGSGWAWIVQDGKQLQVVKTNNADNPMTQDLHPLLVLDVWEHAYYLDFQNRRKDYVNAVIEKLINWKFAAANIIS